MPTAPNPNPPPESSGAPTSGGFKNKQSAPVNAPPPSFGGAMVGFGPSIEEAFGRLLPSVVYSKSTTQAIATAWQTMTFETQIVSDGIVVADSSGASFAVPSYMANKQLLVVGNVEWAASNLGRRQIRVLETLADASARTKQAGIYEATGTSGGVGGAFAFSVFVGEGTTAVSLIDLQTRVLGTTTHVTSAAVSFMQVR